MSELVIHRLNTGWIECPSTGSLLAAGRHPSVPGGQIRTYGWNDAIEHPDGMTAPGTMIPTPAWYIEGGDKRILVDTGILPIDEMLTIQETYVGPGAAVPVVSPEHDLLDQLGGLGVAPDEVDIVVMSHLHYDHMGGLGKFPNATYYINETEVAWAMTPRPYAFYYYKEMFGYLHRIQDRVKMVRGNYTVAPGVDMIFTGGHSPGHTAVFVDTAIGRVAIGGDSVVTYRSLEYEWPTGGFVDLLAAVASIELLKQADIVLVNHSPLVEVLFPTGVVGDEEPLAGTRAYMRALRTQRSFDLSRYDDDYSHSGELPALDQLVGSLVR